MTPHEQLPPIPKRRRPSHRGKQVSGQRAPASCPPGPAPTHQQRVQGIDQREGEAVRGEGRAEARPSGGPPGPSPAAPTCPRCPARRRSAAAARRRGRRSPDTACELKEKQEDRAVRVSTSFKGRAGKAGACCHHGHWVGKFHGCHIMGTN